jgi:sirohydrochlorin ferrochelatase
MSTTAAEISALLAELQDRVAKARAEADDGLEVSLEGLDAAVSQACQRATSLPGPDARNLSPAFVRLLDEVNALAATLAARRDSISGEMDQYRARTNAMKAYTTRNLS